MIYDEPPTGLDPIASGVIMSLISPAQRQPRHDQPHRGSPASRALPIADHAVVIANGSIMFDGTPSELETTADPLIRRVPQGRARTDPMLRRSARTGCVMAMSTPSTSIGRAGLFLAGGVPPANPPRISGGASLREIYKIDAHADVAVYGAGRPVDHAAGLSLTADLRCRQPDQFPDRSGYLPRAGSVLTALLFIGRARPVRSPPAWS